MSVPLYRSLPSADCIRLLQIKPSDSSSQIVEGDLRVVDLDDAPAYRCLSYTWDGPRHEDTGPQWAIESEWLVLNGVRKAVRLNLSNALRSLRDVGVTDPIWIDSICINQKDTAERNSQVAQMGRIFQNAVDVIVWLGESQPNADKILEKLRSLRLAPSAPGMWMAPGNTDGIYHMAEIAVECFTDRELSIEMAEFLIGIRWFSRVWTLQEMLLAADLNFLWGSLWIDLDCMFAGSFFIKSVVSTMACDSSRRDLLARGSDWVLQFGIALTKRDTKRKPGSSYCPFSLMMETSRTRIATDLKDNVFGLLGVARMTDSGTFPIEVDYSLETSYIFTMTAVACFSAYKDLEPLSWVGDQEMNQIEGLPTWVPDYTKEVPWIPLYNRPVYFKASGDRERKFWHFTSEHDFDRKVIVFNEMKFDTVIVCGPAFWDSPSTCRLGEMLQTLLSKNAGHLVYQVALSRVLMNVLIGGEENVPPNYPDLGVWTSEFEDWLFQQTCLALVKEGLCEPEVLPVNISESIEKLKQCLMLNSGFSDIARAISSGSRRHRTWADVEWGLREICQPDMVDFYVRTRINSFQQNFPALWEFTCMEKCIFITERGYIGLGPRTIRTGDKVSILEGGRVPYLFRQVPEEDSSVATFVGEAYVHGIMYGEALEGPGLEFRKLFVI